MKKIGFLIYFLTLAIPICFGQEIATDSMVTRALSVNSKANPPTSLFVHTDKTLYTNNETIWFSGYLLGAEINDPEHSILCVAVVHTDSREVVLQRKYLMKDRLSFGSLRLPDTIPAGDFIFLVFTNVVRHDGQPLAVFTQPLTIKSIRQQDFKVSVNLLDTIIHNGLVRVKVDVTTDNTRTKEKPVLKYGINDDLLKTQFLNDKSFLVNIPAEQLNRARPTLLASVRFKNQTQHFNLKLPQVSREKIDVRFFPEGGNLVQGLPSRIGWEAKTNDGAPVALKGTLLKDGEPVDTISTNASGLGKFNLTPKEQSTYTLKVSYPVGDTIYTLPPAVKQGVVIHIPEAIVSDSVRLTMYSPKPRTVQVLVHNYREAFASFRVGLTSSGTRMKIALPGLPKGIAMITVLDELGQPLAERLFFAHYDKKIRAEIRLDKPVYKKRDSVRVLLKLTDPSGRPVQGVVSAAAVQQNRLEGRKMQDIESYTYLNADIGDLPQNPGGAKLSDQAYVEDVFLVKGWRRFTWQDMVKQEDRDTVRTHVPGIVGTVRFNGKPVKKTAALTVVRDSTIRLITTANDGSFPIDQNEFLLLDERKALVLVSERNRNPYSITVVDPFLKIAQQLGRHVRTDFVGTGKNLNSGSQQLSGFDQAIMLSEVVVKGGKGGSLYGTRGVGGTNACGDYVDEWGFLNYPYSAGRGNNTQPVKGKSYHIRTDIKGYGPGTHHSFTVRQVIYHGCMGDDNKYVYDIEGIYFAREFYGVTKEDILLSEPLFQSTLFWKPGIVTNPAGETNFSFITGDITGPFRVIVQGIETDDTIFGAGDFTVK